MIATFVKDIGQPIYSEATYNTAGTVLNNIKLEKNLMSYFHGIGE